MSQTSTRIAPRLPEPPAPPAPPPQPRHATKAQRMTLLLSLLVAGLVAVQLFASILLPFVVAAGIAYFLDPVAVRLTRPGMRRSLAAMLLVVGLVAAGLLFALLLYPLIVAQIGILVSRVPAYVNDLRLWAGEVIVHLQERLGQEYVDGKLRDLVSGQAGAMLGFLTGALSRIVGGGFALFNVLSLLVVTPVVAFYLLRDWPGVVQHVDTAGCRDAMPACCGCRRRRWTASSPPGCAGQALCCVLLALVSTRWRCSWWGWTWA